MLLYEFDFWIYVPTPNTPVLTNTGQPYFFLNLCLTSLLNPWSFITCSLFYLLICIKHIYFGVEFHLSTWETMQNSTPKKEKEIRTKIMLKSMIERQIKANSYWNFMQFYPYHLNNKKDISCSNQVIQAAHLLLIQKRINRYISFFNVVLKHSLLKEYQHMKNPKNQFELSNLISM